ncbi:MAG: DNA topoisomerase 4 subunit A [Bacilli bacterium]|nr:DNA topoisomerase 4 subunit A [Bacilli bacterium]
MAKKKIVIEEEEIVEENIVTQPLEDVMGDRYATYAKYVIQDRAIPDVRDGLKPVQRRIIFSMYKNNNTINHPTRKCAHTVGAVMGTYHPHGDSSIYEALARMSQDWKVRYPLIDFQGNNGSIDGDQPAAYRYTESRLSMLSNELVRGIDKKTVDMQLNFDDTEFEPVVLPSRFPNLLVNGSEGIAVALATEIPPHNLREVIDAIIYRIGHKNATVADLRQFVKGPDFPTGGIIYESEGLDNIYETGRGRIEISGKTEIVNNKDGNKIIISEVPYKAVKISLVYEIDKIRHSKAIDGIIEVRDESDWKGIRIVVELKKDAKSELILAYLMKNTSLRSFYSTNMVAIVNGRPKTLNLLDFIDAYIEHQVNVVTRESKYDLDRFTARLHIVDGLILASININEVVDIIKKSKDKADSKVNLIARYDFSNEQAEAIVMMPLYKLSHTDELTLEAEKKTLTKDIERLRGILSDPNKLNRVIIKDLKEISDKYGDDRRTLITTKGDDISYNKRDLIAKEETMVAISRDGYAKRCSLKSFRTSGEDTLPGLKAGDVLVGKGLAMTTDYLVCFTNIGNYVCLPVYLLTENRWKDEGTHLNTFVNFTSGEKIIKCLIIREFRKDIYIGLVSKFGQIKRTPISMLDHARHNRPMRCMKLLPKDEIAGIAVLSGDSNILVLTSIGTASLYNEGDINPVSPKAGGIKAISQLKCNTVEALLAFDPNERGKIVLITDKGCQRVFNIDKLTKTNRLGKVQTIFQSFKSDVHHLVAAVKIPYRVDSITISLALSDQSIYTLEVNDFNVTDTLNAKKNIDIPSKTKVEMLVNETIEIIDHNTRAYGTIINTEDEKESSEEFDNSSEDLLNEPSEETSEENEPIDEVETKIEEVKETIEEENETLEESESLIPEEVLKEEEVEEVKEEKTPKKSDKNKKKVEQISIFELFDDDDE